MMIKRGKSQTWLGHALRRTGWRPQRQVIAVGTLGIFIALILGALYLSQVAVEASRGREMRDKITERDELERINEELRVQIAELNSLPRLQARALALGFVPASSTDIEYLPVDGYTANRVITVAEIQEEEVIQPEYDETFVDWLSSIRGQFEGFNNQGN